MHAGKTIFLFLIAASAISGPIASASGEEHEFANADSALNFFADFALLVDRGIAVTYFAPTADEYILNRILTSEEFRKELGVDPKTLAEMQSEEKIRQASATHRQDESSVQAADGSVGVTCEQFDFKDRLAARVSLQRHLTDAQQGQLADIYLNIEGLLALRRPWFASLGVPEELQNSIATLARDRFITSYEGNERSVGSFQLHSGKFALRNDETHQLPTITADLRRMSAKLDHNIIELLSKKQKSRLAEMVARASNQMREIHSYELGSPHCMEDIHK